MNEAGVRKEDSCKEHSCGELPEKTVSGDTTDEKPGNGAISYKAFLDRHGRLTYTNVGVSMLPLLRQGRDLFTVEKKTADRCQAGDVVLYRRATGADNPTAVDPLTENDGYGCYLDDARWVYSRGTDQIFRSYVDDGSVEFILLDPASRKQLVVSGFAE